MRKMLLAAVLVGTVVGFPTMAGAQANRSPQRFTEVCRGRGELSCTIVASGPITGVGRSVTVGETEVWTFPGLGTLTLVSHEIISHTEHFNPASCTGTFSGYETFKLTDGTGRLSDRTVIGTFRDHGVFLADRVQEGCSEDTGRLVLVIEYQGQVS